MRWLDIPLVIERYTNMSLFPDQKLILLTGCPLRLSTIHYSCMDKARDKTQIELDQANEDTLRYALGVLPEAYCLVLHPPTASSIAVCPGYGIIWPFLHVLLWLAVFKLNNCGEGGIEWTGPGSLSQSLLRPRGGNGEGPLRFLYSGLLQDQRTS